MRGNLLAHLEQNEEGTRKTSKGKYNFTHIQSYNVDTEKHGEYKKYEGKKGKVVPVLN
jgi:hypothetical protein